MGAAERIAGPSAVGTGGRDYGLRAGQRAFFRCDFGLAFRFALVFLACRVLRGGRGGGRRAAR